MTKIPTQWLPATSGVVTTTNATINRLVQDGLTIRVLQDGTTKRLLQPNVIMLANPTLWAVND